ncbi:MAG: transposase, partial [Firmicutes bacterium]|nr:transposase [Bacillota bacterium]
GISQLVSRDPQFYGCPWSNGFAEGCNHKTKVLKRVCFGMRNFRNFKKRILFCHT